MGYDRYPRDYSGRREPQDHGRDYGSGRDYSYSSARDYDAAGTFDRDRNRTEDDDRDYTRNFVPYGQREYGNHGYESRYSSGGRDTDTRDWGSGYGQRSEGYGRPGYGQDDRGYSDYSQPGRGRGDFQGNHGSGGRRFENAGGLRGHDDGGRSRGYGQRGGQRPGGGYSGVPQGYDYDDRGFFARAGDEVRSWFGDEDAERRREADMQYDERSYGDRWSSDRDSDYGSWRRSQIAALDRDYDEYRRENRSRFENEFSSWRTGRQTQRDSLTKVSEHMEVVGSDGTHVGTVDKVRGDRILLTKTDKDAEGRHHSIPSSWIASVDDKVALSKSADEAKKHWRDEENETALSGYGDRTRGNLDDQRRTSLNRSFSGTY